MGFNLRSLALEATRPLGGYEHHLFHSVQVRPNVNAEKIMKAQLPREGPSFFD